MSTTLTSEQIAAYHRDGFICGLPPLFSADEMREHNRGLEELLRLLRPGEDARAIREWHESSRWLYDLCLDPRILDRVEGLLGPDFFLWASNFFIKPARSSSTVAWHQDAYYWGLRPLFRTVTVWLAFTDTDLANGAMWVVPGTHQAGLLVHRRHDPGASASVLNLELEQGTFREDSAVALELPAGCASLHDDGIVHGSPANTSDRPRIGLTMRYSAACVTCDPVANPHFKTYLCRGVDTYRHNRAGPVPTVRYARTDFTPRDP